ncbi:hypothetical protein Trydic_g1072 [Trypoxylus dichotomus]
MAIQVIIGSPPLSLLAEESGTIKTTKAQERIKTIRNWRYLQSTLNLIAEYIRAFVSNITPWVQCQRRKTDYYMTQSLSGCLCCKRTNMPAHATLECIKWVNKRNSLNTDLGEKVTQQTIVSLMIESECNWRRIHTYIREVLREKVKEERALIATDGRQV